MTRKCIICTNNPGRSSERSQAAIDKTSLNKEPFMCISCRLKTNKVVTKYKRVCY